MKLNVVSQKTGTVEYCHVFFFFTASKVKLNILNEVICFANKKCCLNENKLDHAGIKIYTGGILLLSVENNVLVTANGSYSNSNNTELSMALLLLYITQREREREAKKCLH